jgi:hypothetical protein
VAAVHPVAVAAEAEALREEQVKCLMAYKFQILNPKS